MTIKELSQYYYLTREIEDLKDRIREAETQATNMSVKLDCAPKAGRSQNKIALSVERIVLYKNQLQDRLERCQEELIKLNQFISKCDDSVTRMILTCRFVHCMSWRQVAIKVGGRHTAESVRKICNRFIKK